jgi:SAM-dependent methyltransferase
MNAVRAARRRFLERHLPGALLRPILEIGAADNPTFWPEEGTVRYLDILSTEELRARYSANPRRNPEHLVPIDYVTRGRPPDDVVDDLFGIVIANHVVEHVPDLLDWLSRIRRLVLDDGYLFLAIPDKRYTFDYLRRTTDVVDLLEHHALRRTEPDRYAQLRGIYYYRPIREDTVWSGGLEQAIRSRRFSLREAAERVRAQVEPATDIHSHVFTYQSFVGIWRELEGAGLVPFRLLEAEDVAEGENEFRVLLAAGPPDVDELAL